MIVVADRHRAPSSVRTGTSSRVPSRVVLLGLGRVGRAVADLLERDPWCVGQPARISAALVRNAAAYGTAPCPVVNDAGGILDEHDPDVVIEVLGGLEPARTLVLSALERGIPVITANKSLLAEHGDELLDAARRSGAALRCEAAVVAGVPFLGTFANRPLAASIDAVAGILNGTSNFILTRVAGGISLSDALREAQALGLAEPDASRDVDGIDAAEKLAILIRQFAGLRVKPRDIQSTPVSAVTSRDLEHSRELGGTIKPVAYAEWTGAAVGCFSGPAFLDNRDPLAHLHGVLNGIRLERAGLPPLGFTGPGAGPEVTARTILDDLSEVLSAPEAIALRPAIPPGALGRPAKSGWFIRLDSSALPDSVDVSDFLGAHGIWVRRWGARDTRHARAEQRLLTFPCEPGHLDQALHELSAASACTVTVFPIVESGHAC